jgi:hypothetical protein
VTESSFVYEYLGGDEVGRVEDEISDDNCALVGN